MKALDVIIRPAITEKSTALGEKLTYTFIVNLRATKVDVKHAIKEIYGHDVARVRMIVAPDKTRMYRRAQGIKRSQMKKALVTLKGGKKLDVTKMARETAKK